MDSGFWSWFSLVPTGDLTAAWKKKKKSNFSHQQIKIDQFIPRELVKFAALEILGILISNCSTYSGLPSAAISAFPELWYKQHRPWNLSAWEHLKYSLCCSQQGKNSDVEYSSQETSTLGNNARNVGTIKTHQCSETHLTQFASHSCSGKEVPRVGATTDAPN